MMLSGTFTLLLKYIVNFMLHWCGFVALDCYVMHCSLYMVLDLNPRWITINVVCVLNNWFKY